MMRRIFSWWGVPALLITFTLSAAGVATYRFLKDWRSDAAFNEMSKRALFLGEIGMSESLYRISFSQHRFGSLRQLMESGIVEADGSSRRTLAEAFTEAKFQNRLAVARDGFHFMEVEPASDSTFGIIAVAPEENGITLCIFEDGVVRSSPGAWEPCNRESPPFDAITFNPELRQGQTHCFACMD